MSLLVLVFSIGFVSSIEIRIEGHEPQSASSLTTALQLIENIRLQSKETEPKQAAIYVNGGIQEPISLNHKHSNISFIGNQQNNTIMNGGYMIRSKRNNNNNNVWSTSIDLPANYSM